MKSGDLVTVRINKPHDGLPQETGEFDAQVLGTYSVAGEQQYRVRIDKPGSEWNEWVLDCPSTILSPR